jgi:hypothetical protein
MESHLSAGKPTFRDLSRYAIGGIELVHIFMRNAEAQKHTSYYFDVTADVVDYHERIDLVKVSHSQEGNVDKMFQ